MRIDIQQDVDGQYRWIERHGGEFEAIGSPRGFATRDEAFRDAVRAFTEPLSIENEYGQWYSPPREIDTQ